MVEESDMGTGENAVGGERQLRNAAARVRTRGGGGDTDGDRSRCDQRFPTTAAAAVDADAGKGEFSAAAADGQEKAKAKRGEAVAECGNCKHGETPSSGSSVGIKGAKSNQSSAGKSNISLAASSGQ